MARVGVAVTPDHSGLVVEGSRHLRGSDDPAERLIAGGDALGEEDQVWIEPEAIGGEPIAHPPESGDHLVRDEEAPGRAHQIAHAQQIVDGHRSHSSGPDHRLAEDGGDPFGPGMVDGFLDGFGIIVRHEDDVLDQVAIAGAVRFDAAERGAVGVHPVIGPFAGDDHAPLGIAGEGVVATNQLGCRIDRVGTSAGEEHL